MTKQEMRAMVDREWLAVLATVDEFLDGPVEFNRALGFIYGNHNPCEFLGIMEALGKALAQGEGNDEYLEILRARYRYLSKVVDYAEKMTVTLA